MPKRITPSQIKKYSVTQKILDEMISLESRNILFSIKNKAKSVEKISRECKIPLSTVYWKLQILQDLALVNMEKKDYSGRLPEKLFRSRISSVEINIDGIEPKISLKKNE